jgi:5'-nucleotidase/UDP-sugar diphosphatase
VRARRCLYLVVAVIYLATGCAGVSGPTPTGTNSPQSEKPGAASTTEVFATAVLPSSADVSQRTDPAAVSELGATESPEVQASVRQLTILYTNDEHGWMEASDESGGAAGLMGLWREKEAYTEDGPFLILSGGDMWTGPAISTWFDGESMADVMNIMGYQAAAIGNHEFDFGLDGLAERAAQSEFPFLSANIRDKVTGEVPDSIVPYVVEHVGGVTLGLIGLTTLRTPLTTKPENVAEFDFIPYDEALEEIVPDVEANGAELLVIVGHLCLDEMSRLAPLAAELGIAVIGGGHCNERVSRVVDGIALIEAGAYLASYAKVDISYDTVTDTVLSVEPSVHDNKGGPPDPDVAAVVEQWREQTDEALAYGIGFVEKEIARRSNALYNLVTDAWLAAYPNADVALTNRGGFRQSIPAGEITLATIVGVLPFDNVLVDVELTGAQLIENIECCNPVMGGMTALGGYRLSDGTPVDPQATYHVLVNDFMYAGGDGFTFMQHDADAYNTGIDWRQPVMDWVTQLKTSPDSPLDIHLDPAPR